MLYGVLAGLLLGLLLGGHPGRLAGLQLRWVRLAALGFIVQLVLFSPPLSRMGDLGPPIYVLSTALVLVFVLRNVRLPGFAIVALGAACNLVAIVANGGYMPVDPSALRALGGTVPSGYSNSRELATPALAPLTDLFALPRAVPLANVFSVGDVLISVGIAAAMVWAMRRPATSRSASAASSSAAVTLVTPSHSVRAGTSPDRRESAGTTRS